MCVNIHTEPTTPADDLLDELEASVEKYGVDRELIIVCHMDNRIAGTVSPMDYLEDESVDRTLDLTIQRELLSRTASGAPRRPSPLAASASWSSATTTGCTRSRWRRPPVCSRSNQCSCSAILHDVRMPRQNRSWWLAGVSVM